MNDNNNDKHHEIKETKNKMAPMPYLPFTTEETLKACIDISLKSNDIFICSYPKSGTTWVQHIIISILLCHKVNTGKMSNQPREYTHVSQFAPFFEVKDHWDWDAIQNNSTIQLRSDIRENHEWLGWRVVNTHLRWNMLPKKNIISSLIDSQFNRQEQTRKPKFIYLIRSPLDVCVSFYHHLSNQVEGGYDGTMNEFFNEWMNGEIPFGTWVDHIRSFLPAFEDKDSDIDVLLVSYEEMVSNLPHVLDQIIAFLDLDKSITSKQRQDLLPTFQFENMKQSLSKFQPISVTWKQKQITNLSDHSSYTKSFQFLRNGKSGDSKNYLSINQRQLFVESLKQSSLLEEMKHESTKMKSNDFQILQSIIKNI